MDGADRVAVLNGRVDLTMAYEIANGARRPSIGPEAQKRVDVAATRVARIIAERRHVYGITTGFGPLANRLIDPENSEKLQQNLVYHLASGVGEPYSWIDARAMVLARLNVILQGASGASGDSVAALVAILCSSLAPKVPQRGTVGASGDLTPLAHVVLSLQGQADFISRDGMTVKASEGLAALGRPALHLGDRDGLALVNGTSAMTGVALVNARLASHSVDWALALSAALAEVMGARQEAWDARIAALRPHPGQIAATGVLNARLEGSARLHTEHLAKACVAAEATGTLARIGQDAYSLRCVPQIIGAVMDTVAAHDRTIEIELNSVTDNPVLPISGDALALHGGNFMGQHVALASDALGNAISVLAGLAERQIARVTDEQMNGGLPAFLSRSQSGLSSGFMGAQVTATALLAEVRALGPASVQSISTNGANQDVVSMGTIAARLARKKLEMTHQILAILALSLAQAIDILGPHRGFSANARALHAWLRARAPEMLDDRPLGREINDLASEIAHQPPPQE